MQKILNTELYNNRLLAYQMSRLKMTPGELAKESGASIFSVHAGLAGNLGTLRVLRQIADALKVKWEYITHIDLPEAEFHRAVVRTGNSRTAR